MRTVESASIDPSFDLDALRAVLRDHPVRLAVLFGSHVTGTAHAGSDIDLAVEFGDIRPSDPQYNDAFLGLSADLSDTLGTDGVDLVDVQTVSPSLAASIFEHGVFLVGDEAHATTLRHRLAAASEPRSPRERLDAALDRIDAHLGDGDSGVPAAGDAEDRG